MRNNKKNKVNKNLSDSLIFMGGLLSLAMSLSIISGKSPEIWLASFLFLFSGYIIGASAVGFSTSKKEDKKRIKSEIKNY